MVLKLGMQLLALELYKVCINCDPVLTLTYLMARSNVVACEWEKLLQSNYMGKKCSKLPNQQKIFIFKKTKYPRGYFRGYIHVYDHYFKHFFLLNHSANQSKILYGAFFGRGNINIGKIILVISHIW